ncbi:MAG: hypothetical protein EAZ90_02685 [Oscillatoriales cyanobacterium]|nr:MAG: hypothetical protein EAZ94_21610 [Oscillatoriales cyanobacterium]TAE28379.1 MAG: hypothetical protein EAZ93_02960 [Oscillatoriales cyanobacterium]TAE45129.1 MAG: hypothetical protein EAZ90_02685 [Oscillatoriales cyanobacterium]TAE50947.1 MAG: hypothetical protein EAZ88_19310 [Oscillatoriales cyanobacterium]TAF57523.1 MAG: hypothetical protein EAZ59_29425 [Oscillatoriales cyanobacterium]
MGRMGRWGEWGDGEMGRWGNFFYRTSIGIYLILCKIRCRTFYVLRETISSNSNFQTECNCRPHAANSHIARLFPILQFFNYPILQI